MRALSLAAAALVSPVFGQEEAPGIFPLPAADGHFLGADPDSDVQVTSLSILALLSDHADREDKSTSQALDWLVAQQTDDGLLAQKPRPLEDHAIATLALAQAALLTGEPGLKKCVDRAIDYLERHGDPNHPQFTPALAAWRALVHDASSKPALRGPTDSEVRGRGRVAHLRMWLAKCQKQEGEQDALTKASELLCRVCLTPIGQEDPRTAKLTGELVATELDLRTVDPRFVLFLTEALYRTGGRPWKAWSKKLQMLVRSPRRDGDKHSTFDPPDAVWAKRGGRPGWTCIVTIVLTQYYRYSGLVR